MDTGDARSASSITLLFCTMRGSCKSPTPVERTRLAAAPEEQRLKFIGKHLHSLCACWYQTPGVTRAGTPTRSLPEEASLPALHRHTYSLPNIRTAPQSGPWPRRESGPRCEFQALQTHFPTPSQNSAGNPEARCETTLSPNIRQTARTRATISPPQWRQKIRRKRPAAERRARGIRLL